MKKLLLIPFLFFSLAACSADDRISDPEIPDQPAGNSNILVAYFSATGNTQRVAERIAKLTGIADPDVVRQYLKLCHPDSLAIGIGNAHGFYNGPVDIRAEVLEECRKFTDIPFVLHGCTGMDEELVKRSIDSGVTKINFGTQVRCQYVNYLIEGLAEGKDQGHAWRLSQYAELRLREDIKDIIRLAGSQEKA